MAFRDLLGAATFVDEETSVLHGVFDKSKSTGHDLLVFNKLKEAPGHRIAVNLLTRPRLCAALSIEPGDFIDLLGWAMKNPGEPKVVTTGPVLENTQSEPDLYKLPIPHHWREDRGRYMSSSVIIAEYDGIRNMSFHRQLLRDKNHLVARIVPRHLHSITKSARAESKEVNVAIINAPDPVVLLAAAMSFNTNIDELTIASALHEKVHGSPLELVELPNGIQVPAQAEYAMWGRITTENDDEGPYVDITGTVDDIRKEPVIELSLIHI